jgi:CRP-like cAMP-binding protein
MISVVERLDPTHRSFAKGLTPRQSRSQRRGSRVVPLERPSLNNHILLQLPASERDALLADAECIDLPAGQVVAREGDQISAAFFPDSGVISVVSEMATGHHVAVAAVGSDGVVGVGALLGMRRYTHSLVVLVESRGCRVYSDRLRRLFEEREMLRRATLAHVGRRLVELMTGVACNRVHSHRQRLARWLLTTTDKARQQWLPVTHEALAQMVGGPRHAVTVALSELRAKGALAHLRGRIEVLDRAALIAQACECYVPPVEATRL